MWHFAHGRSYLSFAMNDQDRDEGEGNDPELIPAIESLDDYVRRYGLLGANDGKSTMKNIFWS